MKNLYYNVIIVFLGIVIAAFNIDIKTDSSTNNRYGYSSYNNAGSFNVANPLVPNNPLVPINTNPTQGNVNVPTVLKENEFMSAAFDYSLGDARLIGEPGSMQADIALSINPIAGDQLPPLNQGMVNVTADNSGYQMLPKGMVFKNDIDIILPYDTTLLPVGFTPNDIKTYYYDETYKRWIEIPRDSVDEANQLVISKVNHFTDFINAIIKTPEMPETASFAPTQMNDIKAANPLEGFSLMQPPSPNNMGTANISYPIQIPSGRQGMQPSLSLNYNSGGNYGWMGQGWDISLPSITVDTRWGVPRYNEGHESETYLLNGEQLVTKHINPVNGQPKYDKLAHRAAWQTRNQNIDTLLFYPRVEGAFQKIIRHGNNPKNFWWEVKDKSGVTYFYGKKISEDSFDSLSVLRDPYGNIAKWALTEIRDLKGNFVKFEYSSNNNLNDVQFLNPQKITYTNYRDSLNNLFNGHYSVHFILSNINEGETRTNCRLGLTEILNKKLKRIEIRYDTSFVKAYNFCYTNGGFGKLLLRTVTELDSIKFYTLNEDQYCDLPHTSHYFSYYERPDSIFGAPDTISADFNDNAKVHYAPWLSTEGGILGSSENASFNIGGAATAGVGFDVFTKMLSVGANFNYTRNSSEGIVTFIDITGDGLPDKVYKKQNGQDQQIFYRKLLKTNNSEQYEFSEEYSIPLINFPSEFDDLPLMKSTSNTWGLGVEFQGNVAGTGATLAYNRSWTKNSTKSYFLDIDGDGLIDLARDGIVFYNRPQNGSPKLQLFPSVTTFFGGGCDTNTFYQDTEVNPGLLTVHDTLYTCVLRRDGIDSIMNITTEQESFLPSHDAVRIWMAPYKGHVTVKYNVKLTSNDQQLRRDMNIYDGVKISSQWEAFVMDTITLTPDDSTHDFTIDLNVERGDRIFFRIDSKDSRTLDKVIWDPQIFYNYYKDNPVDTSKMDANKKKIFNFSAKKDFQVNAKRKYYMPLLGVGKIKVNSSISISKGLTDTVKFVVFKNNAIVDSKVFPCNTTVSSYTFNIDSIRVFQYDSVWFEVQSKSNVDWQSIHWTPKMYYDSTSMTGITLYDYSPTGVPNTPQVSWDVIPYFTEYNNSLFPSQGIMFNQNTTLLFLTVQLPNYLGTDVTFTIKDSIRVLYQKQNVYNGRQLTINLNLNANQSYYFDFYVNGPFPSNSNHPIDSSQCYCGIANLGYKTIKAGFHGLYNSTMYFGNMYRHWGNFTYNKDNSINYRINTTLLHPSSRATSGIDSIQNLTTCPNIIGDFGGEGLVNFENLYDPLTENFLLMEPDIVNNRWVGYGNLTYICADTMSNSNLYEEQSIEIDYPIPHSNLLPLIYAPRKVTRSISNHFSVSASIGLPFDLNEYFSENQFTDVLSSLNLSLGINKLWGHSYNLFDFVDMNGDRFPDVRTDQKIQYSKSQGGLNPAYFSCVPSSDDWINDYSENGGWSGNFGASFARSTKQTSFYGGIKNVSSISGSTGPNGSYNTTNDNTKTTWLDINGDGLPDNLMRNGEYYLNLGYYYMPYKELSVLNKGTDTAFNASIGASYNYSHEITDLYDESFNEFETSISGGLGYSNGNPKTEATLLDINGDGIVDFVYRNSLNNKVFVKYNLGSSFDSNSDTLYGLQEINKSSSLSTNLYTSGSFGFTAGYFKFVFNTQIGGTWGINESLVQFTDVNGDGLVDYLVKDGENIVVRYNQSGKTDLLKSVRNFAGGSYFIDYTLSENSFENPNRSYCMTSLMICDGIAGDGVDTLYSTFSYDSCYYHRIDRESYGFKTVTTKQHDITNGSTYRITTEKYHNSDYKRKGLKYYEVLTDTVGNKYVEKIYNFVNKEIVDGTLIPDDAEFCFGDGFPALNEEIVNFYEGGDSILLSTKKTYEHGAFGNVVGYHDYGNSNPDITDDDIIAEIGYHEDTYNKHLVGIPSWITVFDINLNPLRNRNCELNKKTGNVYQINIENNNVFVQYDYAFDQYGNCISFTAPENQNGQRVNISYLYDTIHHSLPIKIKNTSLGFSSYNTYNYKWQKPITTKDINGNEMKFKYDSWGRTTVIKSPKDNDSTIVFNYSLGNNYGTLYTLTSHKDLQNPGNPINTVLIVDGLGRVIQTKKDVEISGSEYMYVSGKVIYDAFGREIRKYYPRLEYLNYNYSTISDDLPPTIITYDILDRQTSVTLPNNSFSTIEYGVFENNFSTLTTDPNGNQSISLVDSRQLQKKVILLPDSITTVLTYNAIGELIQSTDPDNHSTYYQYNMLGQRTSRIHPDAGIDSIEYDLAGNVIARYTQKLSGLTPIYYGYNYNQLIRIDYPEYIANNVFYFYGDSTASDNRKGRIWAIEDASGRQEFKYGNMGEVIENIRTFVTPIDNEQTYTFKMMFDYDSWNRLNWILYPDGEKVSYQYNKGGLLKSMNGNNFGVTTSYINNIQYDKFEKRTRIDYGNGTYTTYTYDTLQRLSHLLSVCNNAFMQNIDYYYDNLNNITYIDNSANTLSNGLGNNYWLSFSYDNQNRLDTAWGRWGLFNKRYQTSNTYYNDGRIDNKTVWSQNLINGVSSTTNYSNVYSYNSIQPHTIDATNDNNSSECQRFRWDENGNMTYFDNNNTRIERHLCWDEENRLVGVKDKNNMSHYIYDHSGERTYKLVGRSSAMNINGELKDYTNFDDPTLYTSGYLVATKKGYTKHYYAGSERILSSIGQGGLNMIDQPLHINRYHDWSEKSHSLFVQLNQIMENCLDAVFTNEKGRLNELYQFKNRISTDSVSYYYYHPDHLGSSSWITDRNGNAIQHFMYLPFGEDWIQQKTTSWSAPYTFSGKEKDAETSYGYFGARYYDSGLSIWLSVDPMSDKYPSMSPYNYCANNPVILVDPDGRDIYVFDQITGKFSHKIAAEGPNQMALAKVDKEGNVTLKYYQFNDPVNDAKAIENGVITRVQVLSDATVNKMINESGARDFLNRRMKYLNAFTERGGRYDFAVTYKNAGVLSKNTFYIRDNTAYNIGDIGNYMWGMAMAELGIPLSDAKAGANFYTLYMWRESVISLFDFGPGTYDRSYNGKDSKEDQDAITKGYLSTPIGRANVAYEKKLQKEAQKKWDETFRTSNSIY